MAPPSGSAAATARTMRTLPRKTVSKDCRHCSSATDAALPAGGPPTETRAPSTRPKCCCAVVSNRSGVAGSARSAVMPTARSGPPRPVTAASIGSACRAQSTTRAPSATRHCAVAYPSPREAPVSRYTRSVSPRSMPTILPQPARRETGVVPGRGSGSGAGRAQQAPDGDLDRDRAADPPDGGGTGGDAVPGARRSGIPPPGRPVHPRPAPAGRYGRAARGPGPSRRVVRRRWVGRTVPLDEYRRCATVRRGRRPTARVRSRTVVDHRPPGPRPVPPAARPVIRPPDHPGRRAPPRPVSCHRREAAGGGHGVEFGA